MNAIKVQGGQLVDASGKRVFLKGCNMSGMENSVIQGNQPWADDGGTPKWDVYATWKPNAVRIPLNAACFLNLTVAKTASATSWGTPFAADTHGNYRQAVQDAITAARAIGCCIILDLHWCAPQVTLGGVTHYLAPMAQSPFADRDTGLPFWRELVAWLQVTFPAGFGDILFELFNEPFLDSFSAGLADRDAALEAGGTSTRIVNGSQGGANYEIDQPWALLGYQEALDAIRSAGATNVVIVNGNSYTQSLAPWTKFMPTDSLGQVAFGWHPYPHTNHPYGKTGSDPGAGTAQFAQWALQIKAAGHPVVITEDGGASTNDTDHVKYMATLAGTSLDGYVTWQWNGTQPYGSTLSSFYLTRYAADGKTILPVPGPGQAVYDFMTSTGVRTVNAIGAITYADVAGFPAGSVVDHIAVTLTDAGGVVTGQNVPPGTATVTFTNVAAGTYATSIAAKSAAGVTFGTAVTGTFTVDAPATVNLSLPNGATWSQG